MEGMEIVITPRTLERMICMTVIAVLLIIVVVNWSSTCTEPQNETSANAVATGVQAGANNSNETAAAALVEGAPSCENTVKDGGETDVDCGGECGACAEYKACNLDKDCEDGLYCFQHIKCLAATCEDGLKNQDEVEVDCGGTCGGYWWKADKACHDKEEPSGEFGATMAVNYGESVLSGNVVLQDITITFDNGLDRDLSLDVYLYAREPNGMPLNENFDGEIAIANIKLSVDSGDTAKKIIDMTDNTRATLKDTKSDDKFQIVATVKDASRKTVLDEFTWVNEQ